MTQIEIDQSRYKDTEPEYMIVESLSSYPGGMTAFYNAFKKKIKYPKTARAKGTEGWIFGQFVVEKNGSLSNIEIQKSIADGCDEETLRELPLLKKWKPGRIKDGEIVRIWMSTSLPFKL